MQLVLAVKYSSLPPQLLEHPCHDDPGNGCILEFDILNSESDRLRKAMAPETSLCWMADHGGTSSDRWGRASHWTLTGLPINQQTQGCSKQSSQRFTGWPRKDWSVRPGNWMWLTITKNKHLLEIWSGTWPSHFEVHLPQLSSSFRCLE